MVPESNVRKEGAKQDLLLGPRKGMMREVLAPTMKAQTQISAHPQSQTPHPPIPDRSMGGLNKKGLGTWA